MHAILNKADFLRALVRVRCLSEVEMLIEDNKSAVLVRGKGPTIDMHHSAVIMPILVNS